MSEESQLRERISMFARSIYTYGSSGNISARLGDGRLLVTRTGSSFGFVDPNDLALIDSDGHHLSGHKPTKEMPLHSVLPPHRAAKPARWCIWTATTQLPCR